MACLASTGAPLGLDASREIHVASLQLEGGDKLVLVTDGITEAMNAANEEFGQTRCLEAIKAASLGKQKVPQTWLSGRGAD